MLLELKACLCYTGLRSPMLPSELQQKQLIQIRHVLSDGYVHLRQLNLNYLPDDVGTAWAHNRDSRSSLPLGHSFSIFTLSAAVAPVTLAGIQSADGCPQSAGI